MNKINKLNTKGELLLWYLADIYTATINIILLPFGRFIDNPVSIWILRKGIARWEKRIDDGQIR